MAHDQHPQDCTDQRVQIDGFPCVAAQPPTRRVDVIEERHDHICAEKAIRASEEAEGGYQEDPEFEAMTIHDLQELLLSFAGALVGRLVELVTSPSLPKGVSHIVDRVMANVGVVVCERVPPRPWLHLCVWGVMGHFEPWCV